MATVADNIDPEAPAVAIKPPFLRRVQIRGYKSIAFCDVTLEPLTILVGRNASGKSNFLDALAFLRDVLDKGVNGALEAHGSSTLFTRPIDVALATNRRSSVFSRVSNLKRLVIEIEAEFPSYQMWCRAVYRVELAQTPEKILYEAKSRDSSKLNDPPMYHRGELERVSVDQETLQLEDMTHGVRYGFSVLHGEVKWQEPETFGDGKNGPSLVKNSSPERIQPGNFILHKRYQSDRPLLSFIGEQPFVDLVESIRTIACFNFNPNSIRKLQPSIGWPGLERDGRNLARAIVGLNEISEEDLARVKTYLGVIVPEIDSFDVVQLADYETIRFFVRPFPASKPLEFFASSMSDGTLRVLATLVAAFQILIPYERSLVAIEEPETSLHPAALRALVDALDEATLRTQILLTTHSAELLDNPTIRPEAIRVVEMIDGQTVIGPLDAGGLEIVRRKLDTLGGLERQNLLEPSSEDQERQQHLAQSEPKTP